MRFGGIQCPDSSSPLGKMSYVPELDALRGLSVLAVIASHTMPAYLKNGVGVFIFFVLSGFLITRILVSQFDRTGKLNFKNFYARRFLRLMPALWVLLAIYVTSSVVRGGPGEGAPAQRSFRFCLRHELDSGL